MKINISFHENNSYQTICMLFYLSLQDYRMAEKATVESIYSHILNNVHSV